MNTWIVLFFTTGILFFIAFEDFRYRAVTWWLFLLLFVSGITLSHQFVNWKDWVYQFLLNLLFLISQLLLISLYFSFRNRRIVNITRSLLGLGDILFMICSCCFFSLPGFIVFHIGSLVVSLLLVLCIPTLKKDGIPLAGLQSLILFVLLVAATLLNVNPFDDSNVLLLISSQIP